MAPLDGRTRAALPASAFAYIDAKGRRRLPINDAPHVRNALARFEQTDFEDDEARERARQRLLKAARKFGVSTLGFFDGQLRNERRQGERQASAAKFARLPRGTVTFLLADVEGSTKMAQQLGDAWPAVLEQAWTIIGSAVRRRSGDGVEIRGDEYFAVFRRTTDALSAAIAIQLAMPKHAWPQRRPLRVRIGVHCGTPTIADAAYAGIVVHTAARVCSAGHGGQILVSASIRNALDGQLPAGVELVELGRYALAGISAPQPLFQVSSAGLSPHFPKLRARQVASTEGRRAPQQG